MMQFEWDDAKAASNLAKHGIGFETAAAALLTGQYVARQDGRVDYGETRWVAIAPTPTGLLAIVYTERDGKTRIISARKANRHEHRTYTKSQIRPE